MEVESAMELAHASAITSFDSCPGVSLFADAVFPVPLGREFRIREAGELDLLRVCARLTTEVGPSQGRNPESSLKNTLIQGISGRWSVRRIDHTTKSDVNKPLNTNDLGAFPCAVKDLGETLRFRAILSFPDPGVTKMPQVLSWADSITTGIGACCTTSF